MFIFEYSQFANGFLNYMFVEGHVIQNTFVKLIVCVTQLKIKKGGVNCSVKKNSANSESHGFTPDFKIIVPFPR